MRWQVGAQLAWVVAAACRFCPPLILSAATCTQQQLPCFLPGAAVGLWSLRLADAPGA